MFRNGLGKARSGSIEDTGKRAEMFWEGSKIPETVWERLEMPDRKRSGTVCERLENVQERSARGSKMFRNGLGEARNGSDENLGFALGDGLGRRALSQFHPPPGHVSCPSSSYLDSWKWRGSFFLPSPSRRTVEGFANQEKNWSVWLWFGWLFSVHCEKCLGGLGVGVPGY